MRLRNPFAWNRLVACPVPPANLTPIESHPCALLRCNSLRITFLEKKYGGWSPFQLPAIMLTAGEPGDRWLSHRKMAEREESPDTVPSHRELGQRAW
jgi:hypothetical protein